MQCVQSSDKVSDALSCACLQLAAADTVGKDRDVGEKPEDSKAVATSEWPEVILFQIIVSRVLVVRAGISRTSVYDGAALQ